MAKQFSVALRDAINGTYESTIGTVPTLTYFTGTQPATCATADSGTVLVIMTLPSDWMAASSGGVAVKQGTWSGTAVGTGTAGYYRLKSSGGTCHEQGSITISGGGGDLTVNNTSIAVGQVVTQNTWQITAAGA